MSTLVTSGIIISVATLYRDDLSDPINASFFFNYTISIENTNAFSVQLLSREWFIFDSLNHTRVVSGPGVIGEQPVLERGERYTYESGCDLSSEIGEMKGYYTFLNLEDNTTFEVIVPDFKLEFPAKLN